MPDIQDLGPTTVISRSAELLSAQIDAEKVLMSIESGTYYFLDDIGSVIWDLLHTPTSVGELCGRLVLEYEVEDSVCQRDVLAFLQRMRDHALIQTTDRTVEGDSGPA
jgi:coenzyme PQQ synthesis protein D (PqqD)